MRFATLNTSYAMTRFAQGGPCPSSRCDPVRVVTMRFATLNTSFAVTRFA